jgi:protein-disulfide isomerase
MNNKKSNNSNNSGLPALIIAGVLLVAVVGGWWLYSSSKSSPNTANNKLPVNKTPPVNQPVQPTPMVNTKDLGAQPAHFKGAQNASVVIEEFYDFQCPTCASVHPLLYEMNATYGSRIKLIVRNFPLSQIHPNAYDAAVASEAAGLQGKFWEMQNLIFQNQQRWSAAPNARLLFESYAGTLGLDVEKFKDDMSGMAAKQRVDADLQRGRSMGVNSTPTILVNGKPVPPEMMTGDGFKQIIESEIARASSGGQTQTAPAATAKPAENTAVNAANSKPGNK